MNGALQLLIESTPQGLPGGLSQFGGGSSAAGSNAAGAQPFAALLQSMYSGTYPGTPAHAISNKTADSTGSPSQQGTSASSSATQGESSSEARASYYAGLVTLLLKMSKSSTAAEDSKSTGTTGSGKSEKESEGIQKEIASLLGGGLAASNSNITILSTLIQSGKSAPASTGTEGYSGLEKLLADQTIQSDIQKLSDALSGDSGSGSATVILQGLLSRIQELESGSNAKLGQSLLNFGSQPGSDQTISSKTVLEKVLGSLSGVNSLNSKAAIATADTKTGNSAANSKTNGSATGAVESSAASSTAEELKKIFSVLSGGSTGKSTSTLTNGLPVELQHAAQVSRTPADPADPSVQAAKSVLQGLSSKVVESRVIQSASGNPTGSLSAAQEASSPAASKAANSSSFSGSGETAKATAVITDTGARTISASLAQGRQDSSKSEGKMTDTTDGKAAEIYSSPTVGSNSVGAFKQVLSAAAQPTSAPAKPDTLQVAQTILRGVNMMNEGKKTTVTLKLEPESLGSVALQVSSESGKISAQFNVKTTDARAFLEASIPQMRQMLQTNGISLSHLTVSLSGGESQSGHPQHQPKRHQPKYYAAMPGGSEEALRTFGYNTMEIKV